MSHACVNAEQWKHIQWRHYLHLVIEQQASKLSVASATTCQRESSVRSQPPLSDNINITNITNITHPSSSATQRLDCPRSLLPLTHPLPVCLSPSRRPAAPLPVVRLSPPSLRTSQGLFARPHRDSAWHKLWPFAQRGVVLKLAPAARSGSSDPPTQRLVVILPSPRRQTQSAILAASQGL